MRASTQELKPMHYLVSVIADGTESPLPGEAAAIDAFNERLQRDGHWVYANGLGAPSSATVVDARGIAPVFTDGPYVESKEHLAGFWIMSAPNLDVMLKLATEASKACNRRLEVRPMHGEA